MFKAILRLVLRVTCLIQNKPYPLFWTIWLKMDMMSLLFQKKYQL